MEFQRAGDPPPLWIPSTAGMLSQFGQPVAVLSNPPPGTTRSIGGGGFDGQILYIDVDYSANYQLVARVRTIRELPTPPAHGAPGHLVRSALIEFSSNAERATAVDPERAHGSELTVQQEQRVALAPLSDAQVTIDGHPHKAVSLNILGYLAHQTRGDQSTVIQIGTDDVPTPALRMTTAPDA